MIFSLCRNIISVMKYIDCIRTVRLIFFWSLPVITQTQNASVNVGLTARKRGIRERIELGDISLMKWQWLTEPEYHEDFSKLTVWYLGDQMADFHRKQSYPSHVLSMEAHQGLLEWWNFDFLVWISNCSEWKHKNSTPPGSSPVRTVRTSQCTRSSRTSEWRDSRRTSGTPAAHQREGIRLR